MNGEEVNHNDKSAKMKEFSILTSYLSVNYKDTYNKTNEKLRGRLKTISLKNSEKTWQYKNKISTLFKRTITTDR